MCLYPCILLPIHHAYIFRHYRADPTNMPPALGRNQRRERTRRQKPLLCRVHPIH
ncbi:hypothetical protein IL54_3709 [Sphingobium sp. ba1]|nr:hypothetical protein IL54_3709 [Sphingobium sp. ba1]